MPLFGGKTEVGLEVERDEVVAGEDVRVSADIGELDKKAQAARVELGYRNTYREDDTDSDGDRTTTTRTSDVIVQTEHIQTGSGSPGRVDLTLTVPADAPGTADKSVAWFVRAVVDRKRARDARAEQPLTVRAPFEPLASWAERRPETSSKCAMELTQSAVAVQPGTTISGTLTISPHEAIKARGVRVQLRRRRDDPDRNTDEDTSVRVELCGEVELAAGSTQTHDFAIDVPAAAPPSFRAAHNEQHWFLEGVIDVKRSGDPFVRQEIVVHNA